MRLLAVPLMVAAALAGACTAAAAPAAAPEERLVTVGDHSLLVRCVGEGSPAVVFESGLARTADDWRLVAASVGRATRACAYDRAGLGRSTGGESVRTAGEVASELRQMLQAAGISPPYVPVGHSFGGLVVRLLASRHPAEVVGLVLVDPMLEDTAEVSALLPPAERERLAAMRPMSAERVDLLASEAEMRAARTPLDVPLVVLVAGRDDQAPGGPWTAELLARRRTILGELHRALAASSSRGALEVVEGAGHDLHLERPERVTAAVARVLAAARGAE